MSDKITNINDAKNNNEDENKIVKVLDGWDTDIVNVTVEQILDDDSIYRLKDSRTIIAPIDENSKSVVHYAFATTMGFSIDFDLTFRFTKDDKFDEATIMWTGNESLETGEDTINTVLKFINWDRLLHSGAPMTGKTNKKHILSFSGAEGKEMVEIYAEVSISSVNTDSAKLVVSIYSKLTEDGIAFINSEGE